MEARCRYVARTMHNEHVCAWAVSNGENLHCDAEALNLSMISKMYCEWLPVWYPIHIVGSVVKGAETKNSYALSTSENSN